MIGKWQSFGLTTVRNVFEVRNDERFPILARRSCQLLGVVHMFGEVLLANDGQFGAVLGRYHPLTGIGLAQAAGYRG